MRPPRPVLRPRLFDAARLPARFFAWLCSLSFMEYGPYGIFPHDLVRVHAGGRLALAQSRCVCRVAASSPRLSPSRRGGWRHGGAASTHGHHLRQPPAPGMRGDFFVWDASIPSMPSRPPGGFRHHRHGAAPRGAASAAIARHWLDRQPDRWLVYRTTGGRVVRRMAQQALETPTRTPLSILPPPLRWRMWTQTVPFGRVKPSRTCATGWRDTYQAITVAVNVTASNCVIRTGHRRRLVELHHGQPGTDGAPILSIHFVTGRRLRTSPWASVPYGVFCRNWRHAVDRLADRHAPC